MHNIKIDALSRSENKNIAMIRQFAAGGVVIKKERRKLYVLLIRDSYGHWTWPKGHIEKGEKPEDTAIREVSEETGLKKLKIIKKLGKQEYFFTFNGKRIFKTVYIFLIQANAKEKLNIQTSEIEAGEWFPADEAIKKIEYKGSSAFIGKALTSLRGPRAEREGRSNLKSDDLRTTNHEPRTIKAILLDLGNVLVRFDATILDKGYKPYIKLKGRKFSDYIIDSDNVNRYMEGKLTSSQFYTKTCRFFKMNIGFSEFYNIWNSMFFPYPEMEKLVKNLRKKYPHLKLILISNTNEEHYEFLKKGYDVLDLFDFRIVSHEVGALKPHPDIFSIALKAGDAKPKEAFYTDDREDLIDAARVMGIRAYQFTGPEDLCNQLSKYGINV